jgi:hypothetical protein
MKRLMMVAACAALAGCDYTVPLSKAPVQAADPALVGLWQRAGGGDVENLVVLPLGTQELMVAYPATSKEAMYGRAWAARGAGLPLLQIQWIGTGTGEVPSEKKVFQLASYAVEGDKLTVRIVNGDAVGASAATTDELAKALESAKGGDDFYRAPMVFTRAKK